MSFEGDVRICRNEPMICDLPPAELGGILRGRLPVDHLAAEIPMSFSSGDS
jgi:hypothetical protein